MKKTRQSEQKKEQKKKKRNFQTFVWYAHCYRLTNETHTNPLVMYNNGTNIVVSVSIPGTGTVNQR